MVQVRGDAAIPTNHGQQALHHETFVSRHERTNFWGDSTCKERGASGEVPRHTPPLVTFATLSQRSTKETIPRSATILSTEPRGSWVAGAE